MVYRDLPGTYRVAYQPIDVWEDGSGYVHSRIYPWVCPTFHEETIC